LTQTCTKGIIWNPPSNKLKLMFIQCLCFRNAYTKLQACRKAKNHIAAPPYSFKYTGGRIPPGCEQSRFRVPFSPRNPFQQNYPSIYNIGAVP
jgi:hypothetical protein